MTALRLEHVSKHFGGNKVLTDVNLSVSAGEYVGVIGPNGAGKSTLFNVVSGTLPVSGGRVLMGDEDVTALAPHERVRRGMGRSFQLTSLLTGLSVIDNLLVALHGRAPKGPALFRGQRADRTLIERAGHLLAGVGLSAQRNHAIGSLSYGQQKKLEVAMTLALDPGVLLLDEPAAGLAAGEVGEFVEMIRSLTRGTTLLFTEHDMDVVFGLAHRVVVLFYGRIIAQGTPAEIQANPKVAEIYLGTPAGGHADAG